MSDDFDDLGRGVTSARVRSMALAVLAGLAACSAPAQRPADAAVPIDAAPPPPVEYKDIPLRPNRNVDILFLIDDSPSMADKQANLIASFPQILDAMKSVDGRVPSLHIGVATSDLGTRGADGVVAPTLGTLGKGGCAGAGRAGVLQLFGAAVAGGLYLSDLVDEATGIRTRNFQGTLEAAFAQVANAGAGGCGFEQHLEAVRQALAPGNVANAGFLRSDAHLAVVILADEDDCSLQHATLLGPESDALGPLQSFRCTRHGVACAQGGDSPDAMNTVGPKDDCRPNDSSAYLAKVGDYVAFLNGLKANGPGKVVVAAVVGPPQPVTIELRSPGGGAAPIPALAHACSYVGRTNLEVADPAVRIKAFLDQFPHRNALVPICQPGLATDLKRVGELVNAAIGDPCIEGALADADPVAPGRQDDCKVASVTNPGTPAELARPLPRCTPEDATATNPPCWHLAVAPASCPNRDHLRVTIEGQATLPADAHLIVTCTLDGP